MDAGKVVANAIQLIRTFNPAVSTVDTHVTDVLGEFKDTAADKVFTQQVFFGCNRYKRVLKIFLSSFYFNNSGSTNRGDYHLYMVFAYLCLFRLKEMKMKKLRFLLASQDTLKMHVLLSYLFNLHNVNVWCKEEWCKFLDRGFVEDTLIGGIEAHMEDANAWLDEFRVAAYGVGGGGGGSPATASGEAPETDDGAGRDGGGGGSGSSPTQSSKGGATSPKRRVTVPRAPNITAPRPRVVPEPEKVVQQSYARPVPNFIHRTSLSDLEKKGSKRRKEIEAVTKSKYKPQHEFNLHETRSNTEAVREEVQAKRDAELKFEGIKARPMPRYPSSGAEVKLNIATVLREDMLFKKKQAQEAELIKAYESELRDSTEYYKWQTDMKDRDEAAKQQAVEHRRLEMAAAAAEAKEAFARKQLENRVVAVAMREEAAVIAECLAAEKEAKLEENRALADEVREVRSTAPKAAKQRVQAARVQRRNEIKDQSARHAEKVKREREEEQRRKDDLIRQIRALERVPKVHVKTFDPTTSSKKGLLGEMSLVELKERLSMLRIRDAEVEEERRRDIIRAKREKEDQMRARVANIARVRNAKADANKAARERKSALAAEKAEKEQAHRDRGSLALAERLAAKRAQREAEEAKLAEEAARAAKQRMFLGAAKNAVEERHFDQQRMAAERKVRSLQLQRKAEQAVVDRTNAEVAAAKKKVAAREKAAKNEAAASHALKLAQMKSYMEETELADMATKKAMFLKETQRYETQLAARDDHNLYAASMTSKLLDDARARWGGPPRQELHAATASRRGAQIAAGALAPLDGGGGGGGGGGGEVSKWAKM